VFPQAPDPRLENLSVFHLSSTGACAPVLFRKRKDAQGGGRVRARKDAASQHLKTLGFQFFPTRGTSVPRPLPTLELAPGL